MNNNDDNIEQITNSDLYSQQYDIKTLEKNIDRLDINCIYRTQKLTVDFCVNYILNEKYATCDEDTYLDEFYILPYQRHLKMSDFDKYYEQLTNDS